MANNNKTTFIYTACLLLVVSTSTQADHSWNDYHWASTSKPIPLQVIDNVTEDWDYQLVEAISQWSQSTVFSPVYIEGDDKVKLRKDCLITDGKLRVCNARYGWTGWLGQTVIGFDEYGHIDKARVRLNDTYAKSWNDINKNHVMCHEIGHVFGLAHPAQDFSSYQTCMDLAYNDPASQWPNQHDFVQIIHNHNHHDAYNSYDDGSGVQAQAANPVEPVKGKLVSRSTKHETWLSPRDDGGFWVQHILLVGE